jgi:hypothetical protein
VSSGEKRANRQCCPHHPLDLAIVSHQPELHEGTFWVGYYDRRFIHCRVSPTALTPLTSDILQGYAGAQRVKLTTAVYCPFRYSANVLGLGDLYVCLHSHLVTVAFFGLLDLLAILPYYIEVASQQDTVRNMFQSV